MVQDVHGVSETPRWQFAVDFGVSVIFTGVVGGFSALSGYWSWLPVIVLLGAALALRHRSVPLMIGLATLAAFVQVILMDVVLPADLAYAVLFFTLGAHPDRRLRVLGVVAAVVAALVSGAFFALQEQFQPGDIIIVDGGGPDLTEILIASVGTAVVTVGGWVAGYVRWLGRRAMQASIDARLAAVEQRRLQDAAEQAHERTQIAADMHDVVAHSWAVVAAQADGARYAMPDSPEAAERALVVIAETARSSIADLRTILARLRYEESEVKTPGFEQHGPLFSRMRASGMQIEDSELGVRSESALMVLTAYRLLSEALTNVLKHGDLEQTVQVRQDWTEGYRLRVVNVRSPRGAGDGAGQGIEGMRKRAAVLGGTVSSQGVADRWVLEVQLPELPPEQEVR